MPMHPGNCSFVHMCDFMWLGKWELDCHSNTFSLSGVSLVTSTGEKVLEKKA